MDEVVGHELGAEGAVFEQVVGNCRKVTYVGGPMGFRRNIRTAANEASEDKPPRRHSHRSRSRTTTSSCVMVVGESVVVRFLSIPMVPVTQQSKERGSQIRHKCHSPKPDVAVITHHARHGRQTKDVRLGERHIHARTRRAWVRAGGGRLIREKHCERDSTGIALVEDVRTYQNDDLE